MVTIASFAVPNVYPAYSGAPVKAAPSSSAATSVGTSGSGGLSQSGVNARALLDAGYQKLTGNELPTGKEWEKDLGFDGMDRQTLSAIASNQGGQFSKNEVITAKFILNQQEEHVMAAADPQDLGSPTALMAAINYLDQASPEEKASLDWAQACAAAQAGYLLANRNAGTEAADVSSGNPVVDLFVQAQNEGLAGYDPNAPLEAMPSWKKAMDMWNKLHGKGAALSVTA